MNREVWRQTPVSVKCLLAVSFLMNMGFYALIPYLTLYLTGSFAWTVAMAGLMLGVRQFSQQGFAFIGGMAADKFGYKATMLLGLIVRAAGFTMFAFCTETWQFFLAAFLSGMGGSLFDPAVSAAYVILTPGSIRQEVFAFKNVLNNVGVVGSQLIGTVLATVDFFWLSLFSGMLYVGCATVAFFYLPPIQAGNKKGEMGAGFRHILRDGSFLSYTGILIGFYYVNMQLFLSVPQMAEHVLGSKTGVGVVLATVAVSVILFQMKILHWVEGFQQRFTLIGIGALVMGAGLFLLSFAGSLWAMMLDVFIFAIGTMISAPFLIDMVPRFAPKEYIGAYYGFNGYSLAFGGSIGTFFGGWMYDLGVQLDLPWLPWSICLVIGMLVAWGLYTLEGKLHVKVRGQSA
jgi:DHA1 family multidrug resistance protein-like MFS transporter